MHKRLLLLAFTAAFTVQVFAQPTVHFNFLSHNEETSQWTATPYYNTNRNKLIALADYFQANSITWNMQSDWRYLSSVLTKETAALMMSTNNKNILRWMHEDKGVEMDPHAHESIYIYPDVVCLMDSIGLPESKVMGGTIYNDSNGVNVWTNLINGQYGNIFPNKFWQPDYMMGGGTPNHVADLKYFGFWNPKDTANYLVHDTTNHLRHIGVGCEIKIKDTISVSYILSQINDVISSVQSGQYPQTGFYLQTIFFEQGDLNDTAFYNKVITIADSVNSLVASGVAQWSTLKQAYTEWETVYNATMFQWECGQIVNAVDPILSQGISVYPNPSSGKVYVETDQTIFKRLRIYNALGYLIYECNINTDLFAIDLQSAAKGIYFYTLTGENANLSYSKFLIE